MERVLVHLRGRAFLEITSHDVLCQINIYQFCLGHLSREYASMYNIKCMMKIHWNR